MNFLKSNSEREAVQNPGIKKPRFSESPEMMIKIAETIIREHTSRGAESPIGNTVIADLSFRLRAARELHDEGMKYLKIANDKLMERDAELGIRNSQSPTGTTIKFCLDCTLDILVRHLGENQKDLILWGFHPQKPN
jgi:hypothetical protein